MLSVWDSVVGITTCYALDGPGIESGWSEVFRTRPDHPWGRTKLLYNGYLLSFPGIQRLASTVDHPPPSNDEVKERVGLHGLFRVTFTFYHKLNILRPIGYFMYQMFSHTKSLLSAHAVYLYVLYGFHNKEGGFPHAALIDWFL
jgi:hypothetical protein